ncbi:efflux RND transporter periplasmic adaptor subunit [Magnetospirillum moscoviense]|uniref:Efflux transporter periplasmic adaptor subunit n=1 Tax=Magnetospirillum moscoviense TaxID=1437059 RepID=A0A178MK48_9PROT|nr:efflux RND transporter periplasmic adaptor subunit [Magnetospirillum moscoviense]OAN48943.1 efflux transporter periplasmic adaptor subunit [Magnetospirillum moscoviense]
MARFFSRPIVGIALVLATILGAGIYFASRQTAPAPASAAPQAGGPGGAPPVTVSAPVKRSVTEWLEFTGQFAAVDHVELRARVGGYLTDIHFADGQMVQKGDLLFTIDPRPHEIALASARAKLDQASSSRDFAGRQLSRVDELQRRDYAPQTLLDQRQTESKGAGAAAEAARAAVREAELNLQFTRITAPVSGRVGARQISIGNLVSATTTPTLLTTIVSQDPLYFTFDMSEADLLAFQRVHGAVSAQGQLDVPVELRLMDEKAWGRKGRLTFIDNQLDKASGTIRARATIANTDNFIAPGAFGRIRMPATAPFEALLLPDAAVVTDQNRKIVMTVTPDGTVAPRPVEIGGLIDGLRIVRSGIGPDDQVVINGLLRARPGSKVTAQPGTIK